MAAMSVVLTEFSQNGNSRTSTLAGHTASEPYLVIEKRRVPSGAQTVAEYTFSVVKATEDALGAALAQKVVMEVKVRYPISGIAADRDAVLAVLRDIAVGDEFTNTVPTQEWLT